MGDAKRKEQRLRAALLAECDLWDRPASVCEAQQVEEIAKLPIVSAQRAPSDQLEWGGMQPRECHANAGFYAKNDPTGTSKHILGWWRQGDLFVLHSVIFNAGRHICVTPQEHDVPQVFPFIPDDKIQARDDGEVVRYFRDDQPIVAGLRINPEAHRASITLMRERLQAGMKPWPAMRMADDEACDRLGIPRAQRR